MYGPHGPYGNPVRSDLALATLLATLENLQVNIAILEENRRGHIAAEESSNKIIALLEKILDSK